MSKFKLAFVCMYILQEQLHMCVENIKTIGRCGGMENLGRKKEE